MTSVINMDMRYKLTLINGESVQFFSDESIEDIKAKLSMDWLPLNDEETQWIRSSAVIGIDNVTEIDNMIKGLISRLEKRT